MRKLGVAVLVAVAFVAGAAVRPEAGESDVLRKSEVCGNLVKWSDVVKARRDRDSNYDARDLRTYGLLASIFCHGHPDASWVLSVEPSPAAASLYRHGRQGNAEARR